MKRIASVCLALLLALAVSVPAFAYAQEDEWTTDEYGYDSYYDSTEMDEWIAAWAEEHPDLAAEILADDPPLWQLWGYDSVEDFMQDYGLDTKADYEAYVLRWYAEDYYYDYLWEQEQAETIKNTRLSMGGTEEGLAVLYNDTYIPFPDAQPEKTNGSTMVPLRAFVAALGGEVTYLSDTGTISASLNDVQMNFSAGSAAAEAVIDGETQTVTLQCAPYIKDGVAYVPVRSVGELAGYDVFWDSDYETAVIIDSAAIVDDIDRNFSILNKLFALSDYDPAKTYETAGDILVSYTELNSLDGNRTIDVIVNVKTIQNDLNAEMTVTVDAAQLVAMLLETDDTMLDDETLSLLEGASDLSMDVIANLDEETMYIKSNLFETLGMDVDEDTWIMLGSDYFVLMTDEYANLLSSDYISFTSAETLTVGSYVYSTVSGLYSLFDSGSVFLYDAIYETAAGISFLNDSMFTRNGDTYTLNISLDNYDAFLTAIYGEDYEDYYAEDFLDAFKELDITLNITDNYGNITVSGDFDIRANPDYSYSDTRYSGSFSMSASKLTMEIEVHEKNESRVLVSVSYTIKETTRTVSEAPPAGSTIVDYNDLMQQIYSEDAA